jgi:hypothetical protein
MLRTNTVVCYVKVKVILEGVYKSYTPCRTVLTWLKSSPQQGNMQNPFQLFCQLKVKVTVECQISYIIVPLFKSYTHLNIYVYLCYSTILVFANMSFLLLYIFPFEYCQLFYNIININNKAKLKFLYITLK